MKIAIAAIALLLSGCQDFYKLLHSDHPSLANYSEYPDGFFLHVWAETEWLSQTEISLKGITAIIYGDAADFADACPDVDRLGCGDETNFHINGAAGTSLVSVGQEVAHQLGHLHFWQTNRGGDGRHAHDEWFGEEGIEWQVHALILRGAIK